MNKCDSFYYLQHLTLHKPASTLLTATTDECYVQTGVEWNTWL